MQITFHKGTPSLRDSFIDLSKYFVIRLLSLDKTGSGYRTIKIMQGKGKLFRYTLIYIITYLNNLSILYRHFCCYIIGCYRCYRLLSENFGVTLPGPILLHYRAILLHYRLVITLSVNLELNYRLMLHYWALLHYRA